MTREKSGVEGPEKPCARDAGFSLVEVLVGLGLFGLLGTVLLGVALSTSKVTEDVRLLSRVNEESRLATERLTRELRQATAVQAAELLSPDGAQVIAVTFWTDFDGDDCEDLNPADPEVLTYRWHPDTGRLTLTANDVTQPVLAANVTNFSVDLRSSLWEYDDDGDGVTSWQELDAFLPAGNANGQPDGLELKKVDLVAVSLTVLDGSHEQNYRTQVDLRNNPQVVLCTNPN